MKNRSLDGSDVAMSVWIASEISPVVECGANERKNLSRRVRAAVAQGEVVAPDGFIPVETFVEERVVVVAHHDDGPAASCSSSWAA